MGKNRGVKPDVKARLINSKGTMLGISEPQVRAKMRGKHSPGFSASHLGASPADSQGNSITVDPCCSKFGHYLSQKDYGVNYLPRSVKSRETANF